MGYEGGLMMGVIGMPHRDGYNWAYCLYPSLYLYHKLPMKIETGEK